MECSGQEKWVNNSLGRKNGRRSMHSLLPLFLPKCIKAIGSDFKFHSEFCYP